MTDRQRTWSIELLLLEDGSVSVRADVGDTTGGALRRVDQNPADALCAVEKWLEGRDAGGITVVLRSPQAPIAVWTSPCATLALHRMACVFGHEWTPDFEVHELPAEVASDDPATTGIRIRVSAESPESASQPTRRAGSGVA